MPQEKSSRNKRLPIAKRLIFAGLVLLAVLGGATFLLQILEEHSWIDTHRIDDSINLPPTEMMARQTFGGKDYWVFAGQEMLRGKVPVEKPKNVFRIVCIGGSFMMGFPYTQAGQPHPGFGGIPQFMEVELSLRYPSKKFEVINLAGMGQNSDRVRAIVERLPPIDADLIVIASGNNEGDLTPTVFNEKLHSWILYRSLKKALLKEPTAQDRSAYMPQDEDIRKIEKNYQRNIQRIIEVCGKHGIALALCTVPINLRYHDYYAGENHQPDNSIFDQPLLEGQKAFENCNCKEAMEHFVKSKNQTYALLYMAQCYDRGREFQKARELYTALVQRHPFTQTRPSYNEFVRDQKGGQKRIIIDLQKSLERYSIGNISNSELFLDSCHMKWWANAMLADEVIRALVKTNWIEAKKGEPKPELNLDHLLSESKSLAELPALPETTGYRSYIDVWESGSGTFPFPTDPIFGSCNPQE